MALAQVQISALLATLAALLMLVGASAAYAAAPICPPTFELRQEGVNYPVGAYADVDRDGDGYICSMIADGGVGINIDNISSVI